MLFPVSPHFKKRLERSDEEIEFVSSIQTFVIRPISLRIVFIPSNLFSQIAAELCRTHLGNLGQPKEIADAWRDARSLFFFGLIAAMDSYLCQSSAQKYHPEIH